MKRPQEWPDPPARRVPKVSNTLLYRLSEQDAEQVNRRRTTGADIVRRIRKNDPNEMSSSWPIGAQAHIGSYVNAGDVFPLIVTRVFANEWGPDKPGVNGQVLLDGNDVLWVTSVPEFGKLPDNVVEYKGGFFLYPEE